MHRPVTVLVVDDEAGPRESLRLLLSTDFEVQTASGASEAVAILRGRPVDVVTLDLRMPEIGGIRALQWIRGIDEDVEVIIVTGYGSYATAVEALRLGAFDYVSKPFHGQTVRAIVHRAAERRERKRRLVDRDEIVAPIEELVRTSDEMQQKASDAGSPELERTIGRVRFLSRTAKFIAGRGSDRRRRSS